MISINAYLEKVYSELKNQVDRGENLCELKTLSFEGGSLPDYTNVQIQRLYLLRYAFAYVFEYETMYDEVLEKMHEPHTLSVTSIGCGSLLDYWALARVIKKRKLDSRVEYIGIDTIDWDYKIESRDEDAITFYQGNAQQILKDGNELQSDVYFFPKSISEFSEDEINEIAECFKQKQICKDTIFVCISVRANGASMERDIQRTKKIVDALWKNGFMADTEYSRYTCYTENVGIASFGSEYDYPDEALEYVRTLNTKCISFLENGENCYSYCTCLNRYPVLKTGLIRYQVIKFERV